ncbi:MAG TPA: hypothetical protein VKB79_17405 [Bryobacteraceae bacterium]|nr:hypothetical protein [Bryobacteraceae bacterium]
MPDHAKPQSDYIVARLEALRTQYTKRNANFVSHWGEYPAAVKRHLPERSVGEPANSIRLSQTEIWTLSYADGTEIPAGFLRRFREIAETAVALFGFRRSGGAALVQWLEMLNEHATEEDSIPPVKFPDSQGSTQEYGRTIRDVCSLSIDLVRATLLKTTSRKRKVPGKRQVDLKIIDIRNRIRDIVRSEPTLTTREICQKLGNTDRPPRVAWSQVPWPAAYTHSRYGGSVRTLISRYRREAELQ